MASSRRHPAILSAPVIVVLLVVLLSISLNYACASETADDLSITDVLVSPNSSSVRVTILLSKPAQSTSKEAGSPPVLTIEVPGASSKVAAAPIPVDRGPARQVTVFPADGNKPARVEICFSVPAKWTITALNGNRRIVVDASSDASSNGNAGASPAVPITTSAGSDSRGGTGGTPSVMLKGPSDGTSPKSSGDALECCFKETDIHDVVQVIAKLVGANIVVDSAVQGKITLTLSNVGWEEGLGVALKSLGYSLIKDGNVYSVSKVAPEKSPSVTIRDGKMSVSASQVDVKRLLDAISKESGINIVVSPTVDGKVSVALSDVPVEDGLYTLLVANGYAFRKLQDIFVVDKMDPQAKSKPPVRPYKQATSGKITIDFTDADLPQVLSDLSTQTGKNIVTYGQITDKVTMRLVDVSIDEALRLVLAGTKYSYKLVGEAYVVGDATNLASPVAQLLTDTEIIPLRYIKAEECPKYLSALIPAANIKPLKEQNSLLVVGTAEMIQRARYEVGLVDRTAPQVTIEAQVIEIQSSAAKNLGLDLQGAEGMFSAKLPGTGQIIYNSASSAAKSLVVTLQALITEGKAHVLANPKVTTINGQEANITISQQRYFRTSYVPPTSQNNGDQGQTNPYYYPYNPYGQVQSVEAGIILKIVPFVGSSDEITAQIEPEVSNVTGTGPDGLPEVNRRKASTTVRVRNGETIVIGGLKQREESKSQTRTPVLSEIPIVGSLFRSHTKNVREADLVILITPTLIPAGPSPASEGSSTGSTAKSDMPASEVSGTQPAQPEAAGSTKEGK